MDVKKLRTRRAIVDRAFNIEVEEEYIAPGFSFEFDKESHISPTGLLKVFTLKSTQASSPNFIGRWDLNKETLDIDIKNVAALKNFLFKTGKSGYQGHHIVRLEKDKRVFQVDLCIPNMPIYKARVSFNINWNLELCEQVNVSASVSSRIFRHQ